MKKICFYIGGFMALAFLFTGCYYLSYRSALRQFNEKSAELKNMDNSLEQSAQVQRPTPAGPAAIEADTSKAPIITPSTHYILETYDSASDKTDKTEGSAPDYLLGLSREEVIRYLSSYMQDIPLEEYQKGLVSYELMSFSDSQVILKKTYNPESVPYEYCIGIRDNMVVVYYSDKKTVYEYTGISAADLPEEEQRKLTRGIFAKDDAELYGILENFSS